MSDDRKRSYDDHDDGQQFPRKERRTGKVIKILCPYYCTGAVIGTKGAAINQIKDESGTNIQVSKGAARFPKTDERVIAISGELEGQLKVIQFVQNKIRTEKPSPQAKGVRFERVDARKSICKIVVSDQSVGRLIGKGGANVNRLKDDHQVKITMTKPADAVPGLSERIVAVEGEDKGVDNCVADVVKEVYEDDRANMDYNLDYNQFQDRGYGNDQGYNNRSGGYGNQGGGYGNQGGGYGNQSGGYGNQGGGYGNQGGGYGNQGGGYDNQGGGYGNQGGYSNQGGGYNGNQGGGYGNQGGGYGNQGGGYGNQGGGYGNQGGGYGNQGYGNQGYGNQSSGYGAQAGGYGGQAGGFGGGYNDNKGNASREGSYSNQSNYKDNY